MSTDLVELLWGLIISDVTFCWKKLEILTFFPTKDNSVFVIFTFKILTECKLMVLLILNNQPQILIGR